MKTEKTILVKFCGSAVLFLAGAYFLLFVSALGLFDYPACDGVCSHVLLTGIFTAAYVAAF